MLGDIGDILHGTLDTLSMPGRWARQNVFSRFLPFPRRGEWGTEMMGWDEPDIAQTALGFGLDVATDPLLLLLGVGHRAMRGKQGASAAGRLGEMPKTAEFYRDVPVGLDSEVLRHGRTQLPRIEMDLGAAKTRRDIYREPGPVTLAELDQAALAALDARYSAPVEELSLGGSMRKTQFPPSKTAEAFLENSPVQFVDGRPVQSLLPKEVFDNPKAVPTGLFGRDAKLAAPKKLAPENWQAGGLSTREMRRWRPTEIAKPEGLPWSDTEHVRHILNDTIEPDVVAKMLAEAEGRALQPWRNIPPPGTVLDKADILPAIKPPQPKYSPLEALLPPAEKARLGIPQELLGPRASGDKFERLMSELLDAAGGGQTLAFPRNRMPGERELQALRGMRRKTGIMGTGKATQLGFPITPELRRQILTRGQSLLSLAPYAGAGIPMHLLMGAYQGGA